MSCAEAIPLGGQETFSIVDRWKDLCAAAAMLPGFIIPGECIKNWKEKKCMAACDELEHVLSILFGYCYIGAVDYLKYTPIAWIESLEDRQAVRVGLDKLRIVLAKAIRKEATSWQLLAAAELIDTLCRDYRCLITSHGEKCSCLTGRDVRWRHGQHRY